MCFLLLQSWEKKKRIRGWMRHVSHGFRNQRMQQQLWKFESSKVKLRITVEIAPWIQRTLFSVCQATWDHPTNLENWRWDFDFPLNLDSSTKTFDLFFFSDFCRNLLHFSKTLSRLSPVGARSWQQKLLADGMCRSGERQASNCWWGRGLQVAKKTTQFSDQKIWVEWEPAYSRCNNGATKPCFCA